MPSSSSSTKFVRLRSGVRTLKTPFRKARRVIFGRKVLRRIASQDVLQEANRILRESKNPPRAIVPDWPYQKLRTLLGSSDSSLTIETSMILLKGNDKDNEIIGRVHGRSQLPLLYPFSGNESLPLLEQTQANGLLAYAMRGEVYEFSFSESLLERNEIASFELELCISDETSKEEENSVWTMNISLSKLLRGTVGNSIVVIARKGNENTCDVRLTLIQGGSSLLETLGKSNEMHRMKKGKLWKDVVNTFQRWFTVILVFVLFTIGYSFLTGTGAMIDSLTRAVQLISIHLYGKKIYMKPNQHDSILALSLVFVSSLTTAMLIHLIFVTISSVRKEKKRKEMNLEVSTKRSEEDKDSSIGLIVAIALLRDDTCEKNSTVNSLRKESNWIDLIEGSGDAEIKEEEKHKLEELREGIANEFCKGADIGWDEGNDIDWKPEHLDRYINDFCKESVPNNKVSSRIMFKNAVCTIPYVHELCARGPRGDQRLVKFLRARDGKVDAALKMLKKSIRWRRCWRPERVHYGKRKAGTETPLGENANNAVVTPAKKRLSPKQKKIAEEKRKDYELNETWEPSAELQTFLVDLPVFLGTDRQGHVVSYVRTGSHDTRGFLRHCLKGSEEEMTRIFVFILETLQGAAMKRWEKSGGMVSPQLTVLIDLHGFGAHCLIPMTMLSRLLGMFQDNYPELLCKILVVRTPWIFASVWKVIRTFLNERVREKVKISDSKGSKKLLKELIAHLRPEQIPTFIFKDLDNDPIDIPEELQDIGSNVENERIHPGVSVPSKDEERQKLIAEWKRKHT
eukprot:g2334.t1